MATIDLGKVALTWKGTYSGLTAYEPKDIVEYTTGGITSSYICKVSSTGNAPTDAGYWSLMAKGQPQTFNDNVLRNDIATLAIRQATSENKGAYSTNSMYVDVFQDATGVGTETNAFRSNDEYLSTQKYVGGLEPDSVFMADGVTNLNDKVNGITATTNDIGGSGTPTTTSTNQKWSGYDVINSNSGTIHYGTGMSSYWNGAGAYTIDWWQRHNVDPSNRQRYWSFDGAGGIQSMTMGTDYGTSADFNGYSWDGVGHEYPISGTFNLPASNRDWNHFRYVRDANNLHYMYFNGSLVGTHTITNGGNGDIQYMTSYGFRISGRRESNNTLVEAFNALYTDVILTPRALSTGSSFTLPTEKAQGIFNASGSVISNTITASSSISEMGAIISYQDFAGTNALNTDIVLQLSADNGSNYATATLEALPNYSSTIKMAKVNDLAVTAGTQLKYKINFANQSSGAKEGRILGVSLMY